MLDFRSLVTKFSLVALLIVVWHIVSSVFASWDPYYRALMPGPFDVVSAAIYLISTGRLLWDMLASLKRVITAFATAAAVAVPLGICMGWWRTINEMVDPIVTILRPIPPLAWIPLSILWFGIGDAQNQYIIFLAAFFPILVSTVSGVRSIDKALIDAVVTLGAKQKHIIREIVLPGALPYIMTGLRVGLGVGWMALVGAELVAARSGLGFLIQDSRYLLMSDRILVGMGVIGLLGSAMDIVMRRLERSFVTWSVGLKVG